MRYLLEINVFLCITSLSTQPAPNNQYKPYTSHVMRTDQSENPVMYACITVESCIIHKGIQKVFSVARYSDVKTWMFITGEPGLE